MLFLAYIGKHDVPQGIDFVALDETTLRQRVIDALYADALFSFDARELTFLRKANVHTLAGNEQWFGLCVEWFRSQLKSIGFEFTSDGPDVLDVFVGQARHYTPVPDRPYVLCVTEQISSLYDPLDQVIFKRALHVIVPSHVVARALRMYVDPARISILPFLWATGTIQLVTASDRTKCLQLGTENQRRTFAYETLRAFLPDAEFQSALYGIAAKFPVLAETRVMYNPSYYAEPSFTPMHRIAECLAYGIRVVCESTVDVVMERMVSAHADVVFCTFDNLTPCVLAAMRKPCSTRPALLDAVLQTPLCTNWFPL